MDDCRLVARHEVVTNAPPGASQWSASARTACSGSRPSGPPSTDTVGSWARKSWWIPGRREVGTWGRYATPRSTRPTSEEGRPDHHEPSWTVSRRTASAGEGGLVEVDAVHRRVGQQHGERRGQRTSAAAEVDDHARIGAQGDRGGEDRLGPAAGHEDPRGSATRTGPTRPSRRPARVDAGRAVGDGPVAGAGSAYVSRSPSPRPRRRPARHAQGEHGLLVGHRDRVAGSPHARGRVRRPGVRAHFPAWPAGFAHFDGPGGSQVPDAVAEAVARTLASRWPTGAGHRRGAHRRRRRPRGPGRGGRPAGRRPRGVVFGRSMTELTFDLARTLAGTWEPGDEVVVTRLDHDANIRPWVHRRRGGRRHRAVGRVRPGDRPSSPRTTSPRCSRRAPGWSRSPAASNLLGTRPPSAPSPTAAHAVGALVYVDGVHLTAHVARGRRALGRRLLRVLALQVPRPALRGARRRPGPARDAAARTSSRRRPTPCPSGSSSARCPTSCSRAPRRRSSSWPRSGPVRRPRRERLLVSMAALEALRGRPARPDRGGPRGRCPASRCTPAPRTARRRCCSTFAGREQEAYAFLAERGVNAPAGIVLRAGGVAAARARRHRRAARRPRALLDRRRRPAAGRARAALLA